MHKKRPKISFTEEGFIQMRPSLASEIGRDPAIVLQFFIFVLEGNPKYLFWNLDTQSFWVKKSHSAITAELYPYFRTDYSPSGDENKQISIEGVKSKIRRLVDYLCRLELLKTAHFDRSVTGQSNSVSWYSLNYEMLGILNGISVKWDYDADLGRLNQFSPSRPEKLNQSQLELISGADKGVTVTPLSAMSEKIDLTHPKKGVSTRHSTVSVRDTQYRSTILKEQIIERPDALQDETVSREWDEIFAGI